MGRRQTVAVLGAGSWGTALAIHLAAKGCGIRLWGHLPEHMAALRRDRENRAFLPGVPFPEGIEPLDDLPQALAGCDDVLLVVPSHAFVTVLRQAVAGMAPGCGLFWASKGFLGGDSVRLLSQAVDQFCPSGRTAVVSGPTFAGEVARGLPTAMTVAGRDPAYNDYLAGLLHSSSFRAYTSSDPIGVQVGGASKNVIAIAAGIADGLGYGANSRAALITRGLSEIMRLGRRLGGQEQTFMGLSGLGDLALTCTDNQSRNRRLGLELAAGHTLQQARHNIGQEIEGVQTADALFRLASELGVEMPIAEQVYRVLYEGIDAKLAARRLLERSIKAEAG